MAAALAVPGIARRGFVERLLATSRHLAAHHPLHPAMRAAFGVTALG